MARIKVCSNILILRASRQNRDARLLLFEESSREFLGMSMIPDWNPKSLSSSSPFPRVLVTGQLMLLVDHHSLHPNDSLPFLSNYHSQTGFFSSTCSFFIRTEMSVISSENRTCASESLLELYRSSSYFLTTSINCIVPLVSLVLSVHAIRKLCSQSIIQHSPRILLIVTILFAMCHQTAYFSFKVSVFWLFRKTFFFQIDVLYQMLFKMNDTCNLQHTSYDCKFVTIGITTGNCGLALIQLGMTCDRLCALLIPEKHLDMKSVPGVVSSFLVVGSIFSEWFRSSFSSL